MKIFITVLKINLKIMIQYKTTFMFTLIGEPIIYIINIICFSAIYAFNDKNMILGYSLSQMIWYFAGISLIWQCIWNTTDKNISEKILSGSLAIDLLKPISIFKLEIARALAGRIIAFFLEFLPVFIIFILIFFPDFLTFFSILKFIIVIIMAFLLLFLINFIIGLSAFYIKNNHSLQIIKQVIITLFAGGFIPLDFYPKWVQKITSFLPFQYLFYWPIQIFLNRESIRGWIPFLKILLFQVLWVIALFLISKLLWKRSTKKYCAVGG